MQTVNFQCGHCGKLMAVGSDHLGQQVRCPHCQQVVVAPPPASETPAEPEPLSAPGLIETILHAPPPLAAADDIFSQDDVSDDLFGRTEAPRIEIPPDPLAPTLPSEIAAAPAPQGFTETEPALASAALFPPLFPPPNGESTLPLPPSGGEVPSWIADAAPENVAPAQTVAPEEPLVGEAPAAPRTQRRKEQGVPWFMILVFSPLLLYSIGITVFAVLLYRHEQTLEQQQNKHFEMLPDDGDNPGVQKGKKTTRIFRYDPKMATQPLPDELCTTFEPNGKTEPFRIGDLQITPTRVKRERVKLITQGFPDDPNPRPNDSLVMYLNMKNLSSEYAFAPLDNYFDRFWRSGPLPPLTQLEVGRSYRFYGGPAHWYPAGDSTKRREWIVGRKGFEPELLQPGEEKEFFVCTDGGDKQGVHVLFGEVGGEKIHKPYRGSLLWRIRVRRGAVRIGDKPVSTTAVVGIRFTDKAIQ